MKRTMLTWAVVACLTGCANETPDDQLGPDELPATMSGMLIDEDLHVVPDAEVCVHGREDIPCALTDADGRYDLRVPDDEDLVLRIAKPLFVPKLWMVHTRDNAFSFLGFQRHAFYVEQVAAIGMDWDESQAIVAVQTHGRAEDANVAIDPVAGEGPFYTDDHLRYDPELSATGDNGVGVFANVPPGEYLATATSSITGVECRADAWSEMGGAAGTIIAEPGHATLIGLKCQ